jgi:hypothetical protein
VQTILALNAFNKSRRRQIVFHKNCAFIAACHGSSKTQNVKDALAHPQGGQPLARTAIQQMSTMRQHGGAAYCLSIVWLL